MRGIILWVTSGLAACSFGQTLDHDIHYYVTGSISHNLHIFASSESRVGHNIGFSVAKVDPKIKLYGKKEGELIWEGYTIETTTKNTSVKFPNGTCRGVGFIATARYRFPYRANINFYGDAGFGYQFIDHATRDLPLCNNTTFNFGVGTEFIQNDKSSIVFGTRILHQSNDGRKRPNVGQNLMEVYVGFRWKA